MLSLEHLANEINEVNYYFVIILLVKNSQNRFATSALAVSGRERDSESPQKPSSILQTFDGQHLVRTHGLPIDLSQKSQAILRMDRQRQHTRKLWMDRGGFLRLVGGDSLFVQVFTHKPIRSLVQVVGALANALLRMRVIGDLANALLRILHDHRIHKRIRELKITGDN
jgi:hypothetical protein